MIRKKGITVVIPSLNEEKYIERCVLSVLQNGFTSGGLEVIVADGGSSDSTPEKVLALSEKDPRVRFLYNEQRTAPYAFNLGIQHSGCDKIMILGAHAELLPGYLENAFQILEKDPTIWCTGGVLENISEDELTQTISLAMSSPFGVGSAHFRTGASEGFVDTVAFGVYPYSVFEKIGYFDTELTRNQDDEFNFRLIRGGGKIFLSTMLKARYYVRSSFGKLFRQYNQYGYWKVYVNKKHKAVTSVRQLFPFVFVMGLISGSAFCFFIPGFYLIYWAGILVYLLAAKYFAFSISRTWKQIPGIMLAFFILHFSYGYGYLQGFLDFIILNRKPSDSSTQISR